MNVNVFRKSATRTGETTGGSFLTGRTLAGMVLNSSSATRFLALRVHQELPFSVSVDANGGTATKTTIDGYVGHEIGTLPTATRGTDWFEGWTGVMNQDVTKNSIVNEDTKTIKAKYTIGVQVSFSAETAITGSSTILAYSGHAVGTLPTAESKTQDGETLSFNGWFTSQTGGNMISSSTIYDGSYTTVYAQYSAKSYDVDLSGGWELSEDTGDYVKYVSTSHEDGCAQKFKIHVVGYSEFAVKIRSEAESDYDYTVAFEPDFEPTNSADDSYYSPWDEEGSTGIISSTCGNQGTDIDVSYALDGGEHDLWFTFRKDDSVAEEPDLGYVIIPKGQ